MKKEILVDINPYQTRVVLTENDAPSEIYIESRGKERLVGNIYKGRVQNVLPGMQAAFVDIGLEKNAFLYVGDTQYPKSEVVFDDEAPNTPTPVPNIKDVVKVNQEIMVQIIKEPIGTKGARVTTNITLPGRTLVLMPMVDYIGISRRIDDDAERLRLKETLDKVIKIHGMGAIVRTAAVGKSEEEFEADYVFLSRLWKRICQKGSLVNAPKLLHAEEQLVFRTIRDIFTPDIDQLLINDEEYFDKVQLVAGIISPSLKERVVLYNEKQDLFDSRGLNAAIQNALERKVWLKNGGHIIIDQTEALTTIDVNTGKYVGTDNLQETITETNCEAAREIARQLRLRDISGIIIVDFIDMDELADKEKVLLTLKNELAKDRTKSNVLGITQLGLVEMTRKKTRQSISNTLRTTCPCCGGDGRVLSNETMILKIRRELIRNQNECTCKNFLLTVHPMLAQGIDELSLPNSAILPIPKDGSIYIKADPEMHIESYKLNALVGMAELEEAHSKYKEYR